MKLIRHGVAAFILMGMMFAMFGSVYDDLANYYGITETNLQYTEITGETQGIMAQLNALQLMQGMDKITNNILKIGNK